MSMMRRMPVVASDGPVMSAQVQLAGMKVSEREGMGDKQVLVPSIVS